MNQELPQGWTIAALGEIGNINPRHPSNLPDGMFVSFAPMLALSTDRPEFESLQERPFGEVRKGFTHFAEGDVLFAKITPCMENGKGAVAVGLLNGLGCGTTEIHVVRPLGRILPHYIFHYLHQPSVRRQAEANFTGSAGQARVPVSFIKDLELPLPPLAEQQRIVAKLEVILGKVDACRKRFEKIPVILKHFRQSILAAACSGRLTADWRKEHSDILQAEVALGEHANKTASRERNIRRLKPAIGLTLLDFSDIIPTSWAWLKVRELVGLGAILDVQDGNHGELYPRSEDFGEQGKPYISAEQIVGDRVLVGAAPKLKLEKAAQLRIGFAKGGDVILTHNATVGRVAVLPRDAPDVVLSTSTTYYRVDEEILLADFLACALRSRLFQRQLEAIMEQTTRNQVSVTKQVELSLPVPPPPEQHEIVRRVEALFALADQIEIRYAKAKTHVDRLTQSILAKAFRGDLVPQDPNDEPASVLLESIRTQRQEKGTAWSQPRRKGIKAAGTARMQ